MSELLGLIDALEASILEGKKVPFMSQILIDEHHVLELVDKLRLSAKNNGNMAKSMITASRSQEKESSQAAPLNEQDQTQKLIQEAKDHAENVKTGANEYADHVMANLQLMMTKMQTNLIKMDKTLSQSRELITTIKHQDVNAPEHEEKINPYQEQERIPT